MNHTLDPSRLDEVFAYLETVSDALTDWEQSFLSSVYAQWDDKGQLSVKQLETLERIYLKY